MTTCERCKIRTRRTITSYWGHELCPSCCVIVSEKFDRYDAWPNHPQEKEAIHE